jgi:predicted ribosomally synthesized peptide with SipW-like signal peptide
MKRLLVTVLAVVLSATLIYGATLAWFTDTAEVQDTTYAAGTVDIMAGRYLTIQGTTPYFSEMGYEVYDFVQGGVDHADRKVAAGDTASVEARIAARDNHSSPNGSKFYSMSKGGWVAIQLAKPLDLSSGIAVIECTGGSGSPIEKAEVYIGSAYSGGGGTGTFTYVGVVSNDPAVSNPLGGNLYQTQLVINAADVPEGMEINYIIMKDITTSSSGDGYDIDYLGIALLNEGNWNPGDDNYVAYRVRNVGSIPIRLRASYSGAWEELGGSDYVSISLANDSSSKWGPMGGGYLLYNTVIPPNTSAILYLKVEFDIAAPNTYQGKTFKLTPTFEAIQSTHAAPADPNGWTWETVNMSTGAGI